MKNSLDIDNLKRLYAIGAQTPEGVIRDVYQRIRERGLRPDWITLVDEDTAISKAKNLPKGPLYGIPFAAKDNIDVAGLPTTCACPDFAYTPERSARVVELLEAAGAILVGKTNLDQFATGLNGTRSPYGIPTNVFNADYIAGGSSSGSAVAVAAGLVSFALGTDTAGSGRVPAGFNNIVGLKPTKGTVSTRGVVPACRSLDVVSVFALTVGDAAHVAESITVFDKEDPFSRRSAPKFSVTEPPKSRRIGVPNVAVPFFNDLEYQRLYHQTIDRLATIGDEIVPINYAPFAEAAEMLYGGPWVAERFAAIREMAETNPDAIHEVVRSIILGGREKSAVSAFEYQYRLAALIRQADAEWAKIDALLLPTSPTVYTVADMLSDPVKLNSILGTYTNFVNLMDLAAIAVPAGFRSNGLPFGVTLVGPAFSDGMLAAIGDAVHRTLGACALGSTGATLDTTNLNSTAPKSKNKNLIAVVGAHLSGQPLNSQLAERQARYVETTSTASGYRLYSLPRTTPPKPGLVFDGSGAGGIEVEIWELDDAGFGSFVSLIPSPLGIGTLQLSDGRSVKGFLCEAYATQGAEDITRYGGWRNWLAKAGNPTG